MSSIDGVLFNKDIQELYEKGFSSRFIAQHLGVHPTTLHKYQQPRHHKIHPGKKGYILSRLAELFNMDTPPPEARRRPGGGLRIPRAQPEKVEGLQADVWQAVQAGNTFADIAAASMVSSGVVGTLAHAGDRRVSRLSRQRVKEGLAKLNQAPIANGLPVEKLRSLRDELEELVAVVESILEG